MKKLLLSFILIIFITGCYKNMDYINVLDKKLNETNYYEVVDSIKTIDSINNNKKKYIIRNIKQHIGKDTTSTFRDYIIKYQKKYDDVYHEIDTVMNFLEVKKLKMEFIFMKDYIENQNDTLFYKIHYKLNKSYAKNFNKDSLDYKIFFYINDLKRNIYYRSTLRIMFYSDNLYPNIKMIKKSKINKSYIKNYIRDSLDYKLKDIIDRQLSHSTSTNILRTLLSVNKGNIVYPNEEVIRTNTIVGEDDKYYYGLFTMIQPFKQRNVIFAKYENQWDILIRKMLQKKEYKENGKRKEVTYDIKNKHLTIFPLLIEYDKREDRKYKKYNSFFYHMYIKNND